MNNINKINRYMIKKGRKKEKNHVECFGGTFKRVKK